MTKVLLFNPRAVSNKNYRIPNSILQVAASIEGKFDWIVVDGNREADPWLVIENYLKTEDIGFFGCTVMPGPQLRQAIPITKKIKLQYPQVTTVWGGYFASNQYKVAMESGYVDFIINGPGDHAFPALINAIVKNQPYEFIQNLIYKTAEGDILKTTKETLVDQNTLPDLPYEKLHQFYSIDGYLRPTHLGKQTISYHSSLGCPFTCSFCAVVPIYEARWKGRNAQHIYKDIKFIKDNYGGDAIEFHDNNFYVSEKRTVEFAKLIEKENMTWWGEGRIDTIYKYKDDSLKRMRDSGCKMIFLGAESGNDKILGNIDKGGKQTGEQIKEFAARLGKFDIIPEYSFVLGFPGLSQEEVMEQIDAEIQFIKEVKSINPATEIIIYLYSPVPTEGSELYKKILAAGFSFPKQLEDWLSPSWENFDLRKNPLTPWLTPEMVDKVKNFETVIHAQYPTATDPKITNFQRSVMRKLSSFRYHNNWFKYPYELKALQKFWLRYRQPEIEGFASE
ncbi:MAG: radical SAM protein [Saprospiraceae bacterium]